MVSIPEPLPKDSGKEVTPALIEWIDGAGWDDPEAAEKAKQLVLERDAFGRAKYGQRLKTLDGRRTGEDARQEFGDLLQYLFKARMTNDVDAIQTIRKMMPVLNKLVTPDQPQTNAF